MERATVENTLRKRVICMSEEQCFAWAIACRCVIPNVNRKDIFMPPNESTRCSGPVQKSKKWNEELFSDQTLLQTQLLIYVGNHNWAWVHECWEILDKMHGQKASCYAWSGQVVTNTTSVRAKSTSGFHIVYKPISRLTAASSPNALHRCTFLLWVMQNMSPVKSPWKMQPY